MPDKPLYICKRCGACCEIGPILVGGHPCEFYDREERLCNIYHNRPDICKVKPGMHEENAKYCERLRHLRAYLQKPMADQLQAFEDDGR